MKLRTLADQVSQEMHVLIDRHSLRTVGKRKDLSGVQVTLANEAAALRVRWDSREERLFLSMFRLDRGNLPSVWDLDSRLRDPLNGFDVDDLTAARLPQLKVKQDGRSTQEVLALYQEALLSAAGEAFSGNYAIFADAARIVLRRIERLERDGLAVGPDAQAFRQAAADEGID